MLVVHSFFFFLTWSQLQMPHSRNNEIINNINLKTRPTVARLTTFKPTYLDQAKSAEKAIRPGERNMACLHVQQAQGVFFRGKQVRAEHAATHGCLRAHHLHLELTCMQNERPHEWKCANSFLYSQAFLDRKISSGQRPELLGPASSLSFGDHLCGALHVLTMSVWVSHGSLNTSNLPKTCLSME